MKKSLLLVGLLSFVATLFSSCGGNGNLNTTSLFNWSLNGATKNSLDAIAYPNDIEAIENIPASPTKFRIEIALHTVSGFPVGTYTMDGTGGNVIGLTDDLGSISSEHSTAGTLFIDRSTTEKVSGSFNVTLSGGANLSGTFENIKFD